MTLKNTIQFFESLEAETNKKSEIQVYQEFIQIIRSLEKKGLSDTKIQSIETALNHLNLQSNPSNRKKYFKTTLKAFKKYLKDTFSFVPKGYYTTLYAGLGLSFGLLFGVAILHNLERSLGISIGLMGGVLVGSIMGRSKDAQAKASGNIL
jgi:hypothetical protein